MSKAFDTSEYYNYINSIMSRTSYINLIQNRKYNDINNLLKILCFIQSRRPQILEINNNTINVIVSKHDLFRPWLETLKSNIHKLLNSNNNTYLSSNELNIYDNTYRNDKNIFMNFIDPEYHPHKRFVQIGGDDDIFFKKKACKYCMKYIKLKNKIKLFINT